MKNLPFFDANCRIGDTMQGTTANVRELLEEMDRSGVDRALVRHANIGCGGALHTNKKIADTLAQDSSHRLTGVWCVLPAQCGELPEPDVFFRLMKENRIGALTLSPFEHHYIACRLTLGRILDAAAERRIPVLLDAFSEHWTELYELLREFPSNRFIHIEKWGKWGTDRQFRPLLETYPGFHFGITGYWVPEGIRELVGIYGPERFLYASGFPTYNQGNQMLQLKQSGLPAGQIAQIAGGNLENLLKGAQL